MRSIDAGKRLHGGLMGIIVVVLVIGLGQSFASVPILWAEPIYYADFTDSAGVKAGDNIRLAGVNVGKVTSLDIDGNHVKAGFTLGGNSIGTESRLAIRTDTILGRKNISITPRGSNRLQANDVIPASQTSTPYQIVDAFADLAKTAGGVDYRTLRQSLGVLSDTIDQTYPHLSSALDGVKRFSDTIGKRDADIQHLLANANQVASVLGDRSGQINQLVVNAQQLIGAVDDRGQAITVLLENLTQFSTQVSGLLDDNPNLNRVLNQLRTLSDILVKHKYDLVDVLTTLRKFSAALGEATASGPYFKLMIANLVPYQILQPFVDAAFKKRGIDPNNFFRSAGLPAFQFPDPNGTRFPNGAPPPAPTVLDNPATGPGVPKGSPCSYTPPADGIPSPQDPLPCAGLTNGPFGDNPYGANYGPPNVVNLPTNPNALAPTPGVPSAAFPGEYSPAAPGAPAPEPLAPGPPGARTVPIGPGPADPYIAPGSLQGDGTSPPPPALTGPPPPPGPGPSVPPASVAPLPGNPPIVPQLIAPTDTGGS